MARKFTDLRGKAQKSGPERFKPVDGENRIRIVGSVLPGYSYWLKTKDNNDVPLDCLSFDKENEQFDNSRPDPVRKYFPGEKCSWAYKSFVIDRSDGKLKLFDHKKRLFEAILSAANKKLGDPTDPENGWDVIFTRTKTGPHAFNVEYTLETFELENSPLSDKDKELLKDQKPIEEVLRTPTYEEQEQFILNNILGEGDDEEETEDDIPPEMEDDIPV